MTQQTIEIKLKNRILKIDEGDYELFISRRWGISNRGYLKCQKVINGKPVNIAFHRLIMNAAPDQFLDHINQDKLDNRRSNLRFCTKAQNMMNRRKFKSERCVSRYKGVGKHGNRWRARARYESKYYHLGYFDSEELAAKAFDNFIKFKHGDFACLNFS